MKIRVSLFLAASLLISVLFVLKHKDLPLVQDQSLDKSYTLSKMNLYPPSLYRLANIIENRPESRTYFRLEKNFTDLFSAKKYVDNYVSLAIFATCLYFLVKIFLLQPKEALVIISPSLIALSLYPTDRLWILYQVLPTIFYSLWFFHFSKNTN